MGGWADRWTDGQTDAWMDGWMDGSRILVNAVIIKLNLYKLGS